MVPQREAGDAGGGRATLTPVGDPSLGHPCSLQACSNFASDGVRPSKRNLDGGAAQAYADPIAAEAAE